MKSVFFRDLRHDDSCDNGKTFHAAGYVESIHTDIDNPNPSGKHLAVVYFEPFFGTVTHTWRALHHVELFEVEDWEYEELVKMYDRIENT